MEDFVRKLLGFIYILEMGIDKGVFFFGRHGSFTDAEIFRTKDGKCHILCFQLVRLLKKFFVLLDRLNESFNTFFFG